MKTPLELTDAELDALRNQFRGRDHEMYLLVCLCGHGNAMIPGDVAYKARVRLCKILNQIGGAL